MAEVLPKACVKFQLSDTDMLIYGQAVVDGLLASVAIYPAPPVTVLTLQGLLDDYQAALTAAADLGKQNIAAKNAARIALERGLRTDAWYVNQIIQEAIASGTMDYATARTNILASGYELNLTPAPAGPLPAPVIDTYNSTKKGQLYVKSQAFKNAKGYQIQYKPTAAADWVLQAFSSSRITIDGLTSGLEYQFRVAAIGSNPARNYSVITAQVVI